MLVLLLFIIWNIVGLLFFVRKKQFPRSLFDHMIMFGLESTMLVLCLAYEMLCALLWVLSFGSIDMGSNL
jgi:hypothetical protein